MGLIPEDIISDITSRADMLQVVGEYVPLKKAGRTWKGLCPFHGEKTPSFNVNPERGFFKCFGCGESGTAISFLMKIEGWSFPEAVRHLAGRVGVDIPETSDEDAGVARQRKQDKERYHQILEIAQRWFEENLWGGRYPEAQRYLASRGVDEAAARAFGLGFAPDGWSGVLDHCKRHKITPQEVEAAGLAILGEKGHYDRFRARLMFPVVDIWGKVLAFSGRVIVADAKGAKYINSPETRFYTKGSELYGLAATKQGIRAEDAALLVEGNFDVVTLYARGVQNAVAPLGTALTERQARLLARYTRRVNVAFDGDKAGQAAILKSMPILLEQDLDARVVALPVGEDPDSFVRAQGAEALRKAAQRARPIMAFALDSALEGAEGAPVEEKVQALKVAGELLGRIQDPVTLNHYIGEIGRRLELGEKDVARYLKQPEKLRERPGGAKVAEPAPRQGRAEPRAPEVMRADPSFEAMEPPPDFEPVLDGAPPSAEELFETPRRASKPIPAMEGKCLQILSDLPVKLGDFIAERFCDLLEDERLVFLLERTWERSQGGSFDFAGVAQQIAEELGDEDFFDQVSALICAERDVEEARYEQVYLDTIVRMQERWYTREKEKADRRAKVARSDEEVLEIAMLLRELHRVKRELDVRLQKKRMSWAARAAPAKNSGPSKVPPLEPAEEPPPKAW